MSKIILSSSGLKNILLNSCENFTKENDFRFIFGEHEVKMKNIFAEFISPVVSRLRQSDPTINSINIYDSILNIQNKLKANNFNSNIYSLLNLNPESIFSTDIVSIFQKLSTGYEVEIREDQSIQLRLLSILIGNEDMYRAINQLFPDEVNESNFDEYLQICPYFQYLSNSISPFNFIQYSNIINYISSHFYCIDYSKLLNFPKTILYSIISNKNLQLENEDSLIDFIGQIYSNERSEYSENEETEDINIIDFYELVNISALSEQKFQDLLEQINPYNISSLLWRKLCHYFTKKRPQLQNPLNPKTNPSQLLFEYDGNINHCFRGIIHHFTEECGGNVDDNGIIKITASSAIVGYSAKFAADLEDDHHYFSSLSREDSWLLFDFVDKKVKPTNYSIRARHDVGRGQGHPKYWVIEGSVSDNNDNWILLDSRNGVTDLDNSSAVAVFDIQSNTDQEFKKLRIRQINENSQGTYNLAISAIEFFGSVN